LAGILQYYPQEVFAEIFVIAFPVKPPIHPGGVEEAIYLLLAAERKQDQALEESFFDGCEQLIFSFEPYSC
jgi:hypothetical protein